MSDKGGSLLSNFDFNKLDINGSSLDDSSTPLTIGEEATSKPDEKIKLKGDWLRLPNQISNSLDRMVEEGLSNPNYIYDEFFKDKYKVNRDNARKDAITAQNRIDSYPVTSYSAMAKGVSKSASDMQLTDPAILVEKTLKELDNEQIYTYLNRVVNKRKPANTQEREQFINEEYKKLIDTMYSRVAEDYKDKFKPNSDTEFILGSVMKDNLFSNIASGMGRGVSETSTLSDAARDMAYSEYSESDAGVFDNIIAGVTTLMLEAPAFMGAAGVGSLAHRGALRNIGRVLVAKNMGTQALKRVPSAYLERIGEYAAKQSTRAAIIADGVGGAATFGGYNVAREMANQYKYKDLNLSEIADKGLKGAAVGGLIGATNAMQYAGSVGVNGLTKLEKVYKGFVDSTIFSIAEAMNQGTFFVDDIMADDSDLLNANLKIVGESVGMVGMMRLVKIAPRMIKQRYNAYAKDVKFTPEEMSIIRKEGLVNSDNSLVNRIVALGYSNPIPEKFNGSVNSEFKVAADKQLSDGKSKVRENDDFEQFAEDNSEMLAREYQDFIYNSNIPISARAKMMLIVEGKTVSAPVVSGSKLHKKVDSKSGKEQWMVDALSFDGSIIERIPFDSKSKAITRDLENSQIGQINTEKELCKEIGKLQYNIILSEAYNDAIRSNVFSGSYEEFVERDKFLFEDGDFNSLPDEIKRERGLFGGIIGDRIRASKGRWHNVSTDIKNYYNIESLDDLMAKPIQLRSKRENEIVDYYLSELRKEYLNLNNPVRESIVEEMPDVPMPEITDPNLLSRPTWINSVTNKETRHTPESYEILKSEEFKEWYGDWEVANQVVRNRMFYKPKKSRLSYLMPTKLEQGIMENIKYPPIKNRNQRLYINVDMAKILENNHHKKGVEAVDMMVALKNLEWLVGGAVKVTEEGTNNTVYYNLALIGPKQYSVRFLVNNDEDGNHTLEEVQLYEFIKNRIDMADTHLIGREFILKDLYRAGYSDRGERLPDFLLDMGAGTLFPEYTIAKIVPRTNKEDYKAVHAVYGYNHNGEPDPIYVKYFLEGRESLLKDPNNTFYSKSKSKFLDNFFSTMRDMKDEYIRQIYAEKAKKLLDEKRNKAKLLEDDDKDGGNLPVKR